MSDVDPTPQKPENAPDAAQTESARPDPRPQAQQPAKPEVSAPSEPARPRSRKERRRAKKEAEREKRAQRTIVGNLFHEWVKPLLIALAILLPVRSSIADWYDVPTGSMKPTIIEGDRIWVNKLSYGFRVPFTRIWLARWDTPEPGDIVVCHRPDTNERLVKRVIATGGDTVTIENGIVFINGEPLVYNRLEASAGDAMPIKDRQGRVFSQEVLGEVEHVVMQTPMRATSELRRVASTKVPEGEVWVMGDNRDESQDSRSWGTVPIEAVVGQSGRVAISFDREKFLTPRFNRFFKAME
ncbi:MAG: signal peptidase I [Planctomycetota bacterium]